MNWLNSIDNILERGFTRGQASDDNDDEDSSVYSHDTDNQIDENSTWSDDGDSSPRVALSRDQSSSMEEEGGKTPQTPSTPTQPLQRTIQQQTMKQRPGATKPSRPGNIRLQFKRQTSSSSSSSEDESDNDQGEPLLDNERQLSDTLDTNKGENEMLTQSAGPTGEERKQKPGPISLSDHDSCIASIKASRSNYSMEGHSVSEPQDQQSDTSSTVGTPNLSPLSQATDASPSNASAEVEDKDEVVSATPSSDNKITPANSHCQETEDSAEPLISTSPSSLSRLLEKDHDNQEVSELPTPPVLTRPSLEQEESYMQQGSSPIPTGMLPLPTQRESKKTKETPAPQSTTKSTNNERDNRSPIQSKGNSDRKSVV